LGSFGFRAVRGRPRLRGECEGWRRKSPPSVVEEPWRRKSPPSMVEEPWAASSEVEGSERGP